jgi:hypothetical protein
MLLGSIYFISDKVENTATKVENKSDTQGEQLQAINQTVSIVQEKANVRGNVTLEAIAILLNQILITQNQTDDIAHNIIGNLTDHRLVANFTRDEILELQNNTLINQRHLIESEKQLLEIQRNQTLNVNQLKALLDTRTQVFYALQNETMQSDKKLENITTQLDKILMTKNSDNSTNNDDDVKKQDNSFTKENKNKGIGIGIGSKK